MSRQTLEKVILFIVFSIGLILLVKYNIINHNPEPQFEILAQSFLKGHLYLGVDNGSFLDASYYKDMAYWPQGVFPAILLTPLVAVLGTFAHQGYVQFILNSINIFLLYKIALKITKNKTTSMWLSFSYIFSTAYLPIGLVPWSWWFAQVVETTAILLALYEYSHKARWLLIGIYVTCAFLTRIDLLISLFFFLFTIILSDDELEKKVADLILFCIPVILGFGIICAYNYFRFGSFLEFGYSYHIPELVAARGMFHKYGAWSFIYYPTNFYYLFLRGFDEVQVPGTSYLAYPYIIPDMWGLSIFITSPIFIWCFKNIKENITKIPITLSLITSFFILLFILGYFGVGTRQYGYRYALDFYPFLFLVVCFVFSKGMGGFTKGIIITSFLLNFYLFSMVFGY